MASWFSQTKITSIKKALEYCGSLVRPEKFRLAEAAYSHLQKFAEECKSKEKHKYARVTTEAKGKTYESLTKEEKDAGGALFDVLHTLKKNYDISAIWENYYILIAVYMERQEYQDGLITGLCIVYKEKPDEAPSTRKHKLDKKELEKLMLNPIKYILTIAEYSDRINESFRTDLEHAREEYKLLLKSEEELKTKQSKLSQHIWHKHSDLKGQEQKMKEADLKVAKKLHEVLLYMKTTVAKGGDRDQATFALEDFFKLVEIHDANLKPAKTLDLKELDLTTLHKSNILPRLLDFVRDDSELYTEGKKRLEELMRKDEEVKHDTSLRIRKSRWEELDEEMKIQPLKIQEETKSISDDMHKVLFKVKSEVEDGYDRALLCLASLLYSEQLSNSPFLQLPLTPSRSSTSLSESFERESFSPPHSTSGDLKHQNQIAILESEIEFQRHQIEDLTTRLSKFATQQLTQGNPNIADLSDRNRPTNIGDKFGQVFDEEWSEAYTSIKKSGSSDEETMQALAGLVQKCYNFCLDMAADQQRRLEEQLQNILLSPVVSVSGKSVIQAKRPSVGADALSTITEKYAREYRKAAGACSVESIQKLYREQKLKSEVPKVKDPKHLDTVAAYTDKLIECTWYMVIQDPPMVLHFIQAGEKINVQHYQYHEKKGSTAEMCVWPALFLYQGGPVVKKGYVLPQ